MVTLRIVDERPDARKWDGIVRNLVGFSLLQTAAFGEARRARGPWSVERLLITDVAGDVIGAAQAMIRKLPLGGGLAWINRAPLLNTEDTQSSRLTEALVGLRRHYVIDRGMYLRVAPAWQEGSVPERVCADAGYRVTTCRGWASATLDLKAPVEGIRAGLHAKWRNALTRAEQTPSITVRIDASNEATRQFVDGYAIHLKAQSYTTSLNPGLILRLQAALPGQDRLLFFTAVIADEVVGAVAVARYGTTAEYLAGFNTRAGRVANIGQLLLWRAITEMKETGVQSFDLGGMDPDLTPPGIYRFKNRVGGTPYRLASEIEADNGGLVARIVRWRVARARAAG